MITVQQLQFQYANSKAPACQVPYLHIKKGECVVLCGTSGSGKSTFLRILNGLVPDFYEGVMTGRCIVEGQDVYANAVEAVSVSVGSVFQNPATQFFHRKVKDELVFPCENQGLPREVIACHLRETVAFFGIEALLQRDLLTASGGERQRIALATATMQQPSVIVLDEPTANLDKEGIAQVMQQLKRLKAAGVTIVIAEHRLNFLKELADRYVYFSKGMLTQEWDSEKFLSLTEQERHQLGLRTSSSDNTELLRALPTKLSGLHLEKVSVQQGTRELAYLENVHFLAGEVTGIVGANGVGKSTLAQQIAGLLPTPKGSMTLFGKALSQQARLKETAFVMQEVRLQLHAHTVRDEIQLGARHLTQFDEVVDALDLQNVLDKHPMTLSGGQQQRVMIANALLSDKKIFIFDEPTSGLDYQHMQQVAQLLQQLKSLERIILVITHDEELLALACDRRVRMQ